MRRFLTIKVRPRVVGGQNEARAFVMNELQSEVFGAVTLSLCSKTKFNIREAGQKVEQLVIGLLAGRKVPESADAWLRKMRRAFPTLRRKDIEKLKRVGCPSKRPKGIVLQLHHEKKESRTVTYRFTEEQRACFADLIEWTMQSEDVTRDEAWLGAVGFVGKLICGADVENPECHGEIVRAVTLFPQLGSEEIDDLPEATEDDVLSLTFTHLPKQRKRST